MQFQVLSEVTQFDATDMPAEIATSGCTHILLLPQPEAGNFAAA